jgi:hypothetical protein
MMGREEKCYANKYEKYEKEALQLLYIFTKGTYP